MKTSDGFEERVYGKVKWTRKFVEETLRSPNKHYFTRLVVYLMLQELYNMDGKLNEAGGLFRGQREAEFIRNVAKSSKRYGRITIRQAEVIGRMLQGYIVPLVWLGEEERKKVLTGEAKG